MGPRRLECAQETTAAALPMTTRLGNGVVQKAVISAFVAAGRPMGVSEVQMAVEAQLGHPVSRDSINSCLSSGARGQEPRFERVAHGCYSLALSK
jgi:hypothetical protein